MRVRAALIGLLLLLGGGAAAPVPAARAVPPHAEAAAGDPEVGSQQPLAVLRVAPALAALARPLADVNVAVLDTGIDQQQPDLVARLWSNPADIPAPRATFDDTPAGTVPVGAHGWDLLGTLERDQLPLAPDADPQDPAGHSGHGTLVAGVLGATRDNGVAGAGVAPNARFVTLRTCWDDDDCYGSVVGPAMAWAVERAAVRVVSASWLQPSDLHPTIVAAMRDHPAALFVTIPSGNGGAYDADAGTAPQPCGQDLPNVLCVSTSSPTDGLDCGAYGARTVDVAVPTRDNVTTVNGGGSTRTGCATSFAAPAAAGVATLLFGLDPTASAAEVKAAILDSARRVPDWQGRSVTGGVVDAEAAVRLFQQRRGITGPTPAEPGTRPADPGTHPADPGTHPVEPPAGPRVPPGVTAKRLALARGAVGVSGRSGAVVGVPVRLSVGATVRVQVVSDRPAAVRARVGPWRVGPGRVTLPLRLVDGRGRALRAGRYRLEVVATAPGQPEARAVLLLRVAPTAGAGRARAS